MLNLSSVREKLMVNYALLTRSETLSHISTVLLVNPISADIIAIAIRASISPYSSEVTPCLSPISRPRNFFMPDPSRAVFFPAWPSRYLASVNKGLMTSHPQPDSSLLTVVAVALVDADGRVLLQQRPEGRSMAGLWEFPGGKIERGELPEAALIRELREELGIDVQAACLAPATFASEALGDRHLLLLLYACRKWTGTPQALHATDLRWVRPIDMHRLAMPPADRPLIGLIEALL